VTRQIGSCSVRWCDEPSEHHGNHRHYLGELLLPQPGPAFVVGVQLESPDRRPSLVLVVGGRVAPYASALLGWSDVDRLASMLRDAHRRFAS